MSATQFLSRLKALFHRSQMQDDLTEELQFHLQNEIEKNIKAGMSREYARYTALRSFGGLDQVKEKCQDVRRILFFEELRQDLRFGLRTLRKHLGFTTVAVLALALGIGSNSAIFSVVNAVLLRPLPYPDSERLVMIWKIAFPEGGFGASPAEFVEWRQQNHVFRDLGAYFPQTFNLTGWGEPQQIEGLRATPGFFTTLGIKAVRGRTFFPDEEKPGSAPVAVVSYRLWEQQFEGDPNLLGKTLSLNGEPHVVVGIMPAGFEFSRYKADVWVPLTLNASGADTVRLQLTVVARMKRGISREQAQAEMDVIAARLRARSGEGESGEGPPLVPLQRDVVGNAREVLVPLLGAVGLVLLIGCATVANLLLARATARRKEIAIRATLGAGRSRLVRQMLTESVLLALLGGGLGLLLAGWETRLLVAAGPTNIPRLREIGIDLPVLGFTVLVSVLTGLLFGLAPALRASRMDLNESLKQGSQQMEAGLGRHLLRNGLVVCEVALALVLLVGAGLLINSFARLIRVDPGFRAENVLTMRLSLPPYSYREGRQVAGFFRQVAERVRALPGVQAAAVVEYLPLGRGVMHQALTVQEGIEWGLGGENQGWHVRACYPVSPDYFRAMGTSLLRGRDFTDRDNMEGAPPTAIVNERLTREFFPDEDPVGKRIRLAGEGWGWFTVVGVARDMKSAGLGDNQLWLSKGTFGTIFIPHSLMPEPNYHPPFNGGRIMHLVVRTQPDPLEMVAAVRRAIWSLDPNQPVSDVKTMDQKLMDSVASRRIGMAQLAIFAGMALILATTGIYGVVAYAVAQRTREIGIRVALGAQKKDVLLLVLRQSLQPALFGMAIGIAGAQVLTRLLASQLFSISTTDVMTYVAVSLMLLLVVCVASYVPARKATHVDPLLALRQE